MEYPRCIQSLKQKEFLLQLVQEKSSYFNRKYLTYSLILFSKIQKFYRIKELSKCNQTRHGVSQLYLESKIEKIFAIACLGKKFVFQSEVQTYSLILFSKIQKFYRIKELSKPNQTRYGLSHVYLESKTKRIFAIACLGKKLVFQSEIQTYSLILFSKIQKFYRIKELSKSNQTRYGVSHVYLESKTKRIFAIACLGKKFVFQSEIQTYSLILFSKIQKFYRIKELSKTNQTRHGVSHVYLESKTKRIFAIACLGKKFVFQSEIFDLFAYSIFKNIEILSDQGVVQM